MITKIKSFLVPYKDAIVGNQFLTPSWERFFQSLAELVSPLGYEMTFDLLNDQSSAASLDNLQFDYRRTTFVSMEYVIKRVRFAGPSSESLVETGILHIYFDPGSEEWGVRKVDSGPDSSGVTFSISAEGSLKYSSTNLSGNNVLFKLSVRTMSMRSLVNGNYKII